MRPWLLDVFSRKLLSFAGTITSHTEIRLLFVVAEDAIQIVVRRDLGASFNSHLCKRFRETPGGFLVPLES